MAPSDLSCEFFNVSLPAEYVAVVEIDRPKKLNSFTAKMFADLGAIFKQLSHDPDVRAIILTAAGERAFTAGLDINAASEGALGGDGIKGAEEKDTARKAWDLRRHIKDLQEPVGYLESCEKPVICVSMCYLELSFEVWGFWMLTLYLQCTASATGPRLICQRAAISDFAPRILLFLYERSLLAWPQILEL